MVKIKLDDTHWLASDSNQWILQVEEESGRFRPEGYYTTLESLLKDILELHLRTSEASSFKSLLKVHLKNIKALNQLLQPLKVKMVPLLKGDE